MPCTMKRQEGKTWEVTSPIISPMLLSQKIEAETVVKEEVEEEARVEADGTTGVNPETTKDEVTPASLAITVARRVT